MSDEKDLFAELEGIFDSVEEDSYVDVTKMTNTELFDMVQDLTSELMAMQQSIKPRSQEARDKHSLRNACQVEMRLRGLPV